MNDRIKINRALISVSDKSGIESLARVLHDFGCELIATGGTRRVLEDAGFPVTEVSEITANPEAFGGRMKTISFQLESALLYDREKDQTEAEQLGIKPIDLVVCNLYPFDRVKSRGAGFEELIDNIDIGGPTMVRAAAKNFKYVAVVTRPMDYEDIVKELKATDGQLSYETRFHLMRRAFNLTADYDAMIATAMDEAAEDKSLRLAYDSSTKLRYGENSHQEGVLMRRRSAGDSLFDMEVLHGKAVSFNNIMDIYSAVESVRDLKQNGCAIIKHTNPCGLAQGDDQRTVFERAWAGDPVSAFGSVIAFNRTVEKKTVEFLALDHTDKMKRKFVEVVIAPDFSEEARTYLFQHKNLRVVTFDPNKLDKAWDFKFLPGGLLMQDPDRRLHDKQEWVTEAKNKIDDELLPFGLIAVRQLKSNAIAVVRKDKDGYLQLLGMGCGQPNRLNSTELALRRTHENLKMEIEGSVDEVRDYVKAEVEKSVLVSDAFFPFPDNIELAAKFDIKTIVQPGGSIRDKAVIQKCNDLGIAMMMTGLRHFKH